MKELVCICMLALMTVASNGNSSAVGTENYESAAPSKKVAVNIEGTVAVINDGEITLDDGRVVVISEDTVFGGDPDTNNTVSDEISVGNYIQGFTSGDPDADIVTADRIYVNIVA